MTDDPRIAGLAGVAAWVTGTLASVLIDNLGTIAGIVSAALAPAVAVVALWVRKMILEREAERAEAEAERDEKMDQRFANLEAQIRGTEMLLSKAINTSEHLAQHLARVEAEAQRAHDRLERGREKISRLEVDIASVRATAGRRFGRRDESNG